ncbi:MAG: hypothetical protein PHR35_22340 [Kiritimatiellae bacterium]|nr:hypothetical protein [Kiritimatiellia bacterium]
MTRNEQTICSINGTFCDAMRRMRAKRDGYGFQVVHFADRASKTIRTAVKYRRTKSHKGVLLNQCPWCGGDFTAAFLPARLPQKRAQVKRITKMVFGVNP